MFPLLLFITFAKVQFLYKVFVIMLERNLKRGREREKMFIKFCAICSDESVCRELYILLFIENVIYLPIFILLFSLLDKLCPMGLILRNANFSMAYHPRETINVPDSRKSVPRNGETSRHPAL